MALTLERLRGNCVNTLEETWGERGILREAVC